MLSDMTSIPWDAATDRVRYNFTAPHLGNARLGPVSCDRWELRIEPGGPPRPSARPPRRPPVGPALASRWVGMRPSSVSRCRFPVTVDRSSPSHWSLRGFVPSRRALIDADFRPSVSISRPLLSRPMVLRTTSGNGAIGIPDF